MILYCAADPNYFTHYFDIWIKQCQKYYPNMKKIIALYNPTEETFKKCKEYDVKWKRAELLDNPERKHYYLLRWYNLPYEENELILETQINCLPVKTQLFKDDNEGVEHLRISRIKSGNRIGGVSAAVFTPNAAKKVVEHAKEMFSDPPDDDHPMNLWQEQNLTHKSVITEQQFKTMKQQLNDDTCWITAGTSKKFTVEQKLELLNYYKR